jgi:hypothetical protein
MRLNLLLLMAVAFLPFRTRLVAEAIRDTDAERAAVIVYGGLGLAILRPMRPGARPGFDSRPELRAVGCGDAEPDRGAGGAEGLARREDHRDLGGLALFTELILEGIGHVALHPSESSPASSCQ